MKHNHFHKYSRMEYYISDVRDGSVGFNDDVSTGRIINNRQKIADTNGFKLENIVSMKQAHTSNCYEVTQSDIGAGSMDFSTGIFNTDGLLTIEKKVVLLALSADCPLLLIYNEPKQVLAVVHSGWRGTQKDVVPNMLTMMMDKYCCNHELTQVIISPMAGLCCYQIQEDVRTMFVKKFSEDVVEKNDKGLFLNLKLAITKQLQQLKIQDENMFFHEECTICNPRYFSYRRDNASAGRFGLFAWLK